MVLAQRQAERTLQDQRFHPRKSLALGFDSGHGGVRGAPRRRQLDRDHDRAKGRDRSGNRYPEPGAPAQARVDSGRAEPKITLRRMPAPRLGCPTLKCTSSFNVVLVTPAEAAARVTGRSSDLWIPASAGMTNDRLEFRIQTIMSRYNFRESESK